LGATIAWSYDLLEPVERQVFRRLGVFSSSADIDAIAAGTGDGSDDPYTAGRELSPAAAIGLAIGVRSPSTP
jgi:predicted ATPase